VSSDSIFATFLRKRPEAPRRASFLVFTSAGEVGVDISPDHLVYDPTPFHSLAERVGRSPVSVLELEIDLVHGSGPTKRALTEELEDAPAGTLMLIREYPSKRAVRAHQQHGGRVPATGQPVISVDTKKKEWVGVSRMPGQEWQPTGAAEPVRVHDFPGDAVGKQSRTASTTWRATKPG
jgi:hypothetical protein